MEKGRIRRKRKPLRVSSQFNIGSMTKGFTAAAILRLRSQHQLSFSDPVSRFFPHAPESKRGNHRFPSPHTHLGAEGTFGWHGDHATRRRGQRDTLAASSTLRGLIIDTRTMTTAAGGDHRGSFRRHVGGLHQARASRARAHAIYQLSGRRLATRARTECEVRRETLPLVTGSTMRAVGRAESSELGVTSDARESGAAIQIHYGYGARVYIRNGRISELMTRGM